MRMRLGKPTLTLAVLISFTLMIAACGDAGTPESLPDPTSSTSQGDLFATTLPTDEDADTTIAELDVLIDPLPMAETRVVDDALGLLKSPSEPRTLTISGAIDNTAEPERLQVVVDRTRLEVYPFGRRDPLPTDEASAAEAVVVSADGTELDRVPFSVRRPRQGELDDIVVHLPWSSTLEPNSYDFYVAVPMWPAVDSVVIEVGGEPVHRVERSSSIPQLDVSVEGSVVSWDVSDADGDRVIVTVLGRQADALVPIGGGGGTFTVVSSTPDAEFLIDAVDVATSGLPPANDTSVIIVASDGFNMVAIEVDGLTVEASRPEVFITEPYEGWTFGQQNPLPLQATAVGSTTDGYKALDADDLPEGWTVVWSSDRNGVIAEGLELFLQPNEFSLDLGRHVVTVTVTDPYGNQASDDVTMDIAT